MGDWLDFGPFGDEEDEYDEDGETAEFETSQASSVDNVYVCSNCRREYRGEEGEDVLFRTVVDISQRYPQLDFRRHALGRLTVRAHGKYIAVEDACQECWGREAWARIQRAYGYQSR